MNQGSKTTTDHDELRAWVAARDGAPTTAGPMTRRVEGVIQEQEGVDSLEKIS